MSERAVRFCGICGARVSRSSSTWTAPIAYCGAHSDVPRLDNPPPDPLVSLPTMATELRSNGRVCQACEGVGTLYPGVECDHCNGAGTTSALRREDTQPREGKAI